MRETILVSIIVPVYNVEKYVKKCIDSLCAQTYSNIEILLIDDGSTDTSLQILNKYKEIDNRIRVFHKENEGLGPTRNYGLEKAVGAHIMYVDSDDYVMPSIVEELLRCSCAYQSDVSICDRFDESEKTGARTLVKNSFPDGRAAVSPKEYPSIVAGISCIAMAKLYNRQFLIRHGIQQPSCKMEDVITPVTIALANCVSYVKKPLYIYVNDRDGSITNNLNFIDNIDYLKILIKEFQLRGLDYQFQKQLKEIIAFRTSWNINKAYSIMNRRIANYRTEIIKYLKEQELTADISICSIEVIAEVCVIGSYNLMIVGKMLASIAATEQLEHHYSFSSIISMMSKRNLSVLEELIEGENEYRVNHIVKDIQKLFKNTSKTQMRKCKTILIDFLEERFPVGKLEDGTYITLSDAFMRSNLSKKIKYQVIEPFSKEHMMLWKESCDQLFHLLKTRYPEKKIVLVKMFLTEKYGEKGELRTYSDVNISKINNNLKIYYDYFIQSYKNVIIIDFTESENFYTDMYYRHGCYPWHLNADMYKELRDQIEEVI